MISRKRIAALLLALFLLLQIPVFSRAAGEPMEEILGVYEGYYYAYQGQTGVTLTVYKEDGQVKAIFDFYNLPNRTNAKEGAFYMDVTYSDGKYHFKAADWISRPSSYNTVDVDPASLDGHVLTGTVVATTGIYTFYAEKANDAYRAVQESIFDGHRYQVVEEGMTWPEAEAYAEERGGFLACIGSREEQEFLQTLIGKGNMYQYWIGARRDAGSFVWVSGEAMTYTNWDKGEPNNHRSAEDYGQIYRLANPAISGSRAYAWNDAPIDNTIAGEEDFFSLSHVGFIIEFPPVSKASDWASLGLEEAYEQDLIPDVLIGKDMTETITRGEFAAVAVKLYEALTGNRMIIAMDAPFTDIDDAAERLYILKAYNYQIVNGTSLTTYSPEDLLTREQMCTMLTRVYKKAQWPDYTIGEDAKYPLDHSGTAKFDDDAQISAYAYSSVYFMVKNGIVNGIGNNLFAPKNTTSAQAAQYYANATRQQALLISTRSKSAFG